MDVSQHCEHEGPDEAPGFRIRLGARGHNLPAGILQVESVVLLEVLRRRACLSKEEQGELVSAVRDCAGE